MAATILPLVPLIVGGAAAGAVMAGVMDRPLWQGALTGAAAGGLGGWAAGIGSTATAGPGTVGNIATTGGS